MKITVNFDLTPDEFRRAMGLPDVQEFQQEFFKIMLEKLQSGEEGYDAFSLYQSMMKEGMDGFGKLQNMMFSAMGGNS